jgi:enoyl-CoA hydratase/carnithine racemase
MGEFVKVDLETAPRVATIRLERPPMNAINSQIIAELDAAAVALAGNPDIGGIVLWGGPDIFAAGADVKEFADFGPKEASELSTRLNNAFSRFAALPQVTVAAVCGFALGGGCELAMCADFRLMADDARFGQPEILLGIIPGAGGTQRLTRLVGVTAAKELIYSGRQVKSEEALTLGLASAVYPAPELYDRSVEMAARFAAGPAATSLAKAAIDDGVDLPVDDALALEAVHFGASFGTGDAQIGLQSFLENGPGKAEFKGN